MIHHVNLCTAKCRIQVHQTQFMQFFLLAARGTWHYVSLGIALVVSNLSYFLSDHILTSRSNQVFTSFHCFHIILLLFYSLCNTSVPLHHYILPIPLSYLSYVGVTGISRSWHCTIVFLSSYYHGGVDITSVPSHHHNSYLLAVIILPPFPIIGQCPLSDATPQSNHI